MRPIVTWGERFILRLEKRIGFTRLKDYDASGALTLYPRCSVTNHNSHFLLLITLLCPSLQSQAGDPATENYQQAALRQGVSEEFIGKPIRIESAESTATISTVMLLTSDAQPHPGTRVVLRGASGADDLYIDVNDAAQLREDFASFANWREADLNCEAISICVQGVARCSPSSLEPRAICPATYSTPEGERGVILSTEIGSFRFPSAKTSAFVDALDASLEQMSTMPSLNERASQH